jgi:DNA-damage-inducible protein J
MADTATLNVRMDADTKRDFSIFCDELGMSASSLMNVFAKTVVRNQAVPFPLTSHTISVPERYARIFPKSDAELMEMLSASAATPLEDCVSAEEGAAVIMERMGW